MHLFELRASTATDSGRRSRNEDAYLIDAAHGVYAVADGVGGHEGGETASRLAIERLARFYTPSSTTEIDPPDISEARLDLAFRLAHRAVGALPTGRTTLVALRFTGEGRVVVGHVGDSRAYRLRAGRLEQLTRDHSLVAELEAAGVGAHTKANAHLLTRALGSGAPGHDLRVVDARPGDRFLLCSDGLSSIVSPRRIASILGAAPIELAAAALVSEAWYADARDNITTVAISVGRAARA